MVVTLKGREGDTFEGANLGSEIVVTHNLDKHDKGRTTGSYKINGQAASKAKVKLLAEYLNIQVDNPCVVLTQSVSSAFLRNAKNGELLYQFFLLASGLQPLRVTYREAQKQAPPRHRLRHRLRTRLRTRLRSRRRSRLRSRLRSRRRTLRRSDP